MGHWLIWSSIHGANPLVPWTGPLQTPSTQPFSGSTTRCTAVKSGGCGFSRCRRISRHQWNWRKVSLFVPVPKSCFLDPKVSLAWRVDRWESGFSPGLEAEQMPSSLESLTLGFSFNQSLERVAWPRCLTLVVGEQQNSRVFSFFVL